MPIAHPHILLKVSFVSLHPKAVIQSKSYLSSNVCTRVAKVVQSAVAERSGSSLKRKDPQHTFFIAVKLLPQLSAF